MYTAHGINYSTMRNKEIWEIEEIKEIGDIGEIPLYPYTLFPLYPFYPFAKCTVLSRLVYNIFRNIEQFNHKSYEKSPTLQIT